MELDEIAIDQLTCQMLTGGLSSEEQGRLDALISGRQENFDFYQERLAYYQSAAVKARAYDSAAMEEGAWAKIDHRKTLRRRMYYSAAAAGALMIASLTYLLLPQRREPAKLAANPAASTGIILQLPDGKTIDLSETTGQVTAGNTTLQNGNKTLSYITSNGKGTGGFATLHVPIGKDYKLKMADGSEIWLNSATTVKFPFAFDQNREITITGEAYIKVAPNTARPFLVYLPGSTVQVLGTEFNVNTYDSLRNSVALVKGSVKFLAPGDTQLIKPGYAATFTQGSGISVSAFDEDLLSWREGIFNFYEVSLQEICQVLPRWFGVQAVMDNQAIATKKFTGKLNRNKPLEKQLAAFVETAGINYYFESGVLHFK